MNVCIRTYVLESVFACVCVRLIMLNADVSTAGNEHTTKAMNKLKCPHCLLNRSMYLYACEHVRTFLKNLIIARLST